MAIGPLIDVGDGTLIVPPPAAPPPQLAPAAPPPVLPATGSPPVSLPQAPPSASGGGDRPIVGPGQAFIDLGDILSPPVLILPPPASGSGSGGAGGDDGSGGAVGGTDDLGDVAREAEANAPDLSDLEDVEILDLFGIQTYAVTNPPLKGGSALAAIVQAASDFGIDGLAVVANALHEGASGGIGDGGHSYGPFQLATFGALPEPYRSRGANNAITNGWAWSENGIRYAVRQMATSRPSARGLRGHAAVYAIVYGFERPADKAGAYRTRAAEYDKLIGLGSRWPQYAAPLFKGPANVTAVDTTPIVPTPEKAYKPAGVLSQWRGLVDVFKDDVPKQHRRVESLAKSMLEVFR